MLLVRLPWLGPFSSSCHIWSDMKDITEANNWVTSLGEGYWQSNCKIGAIYSWRSEIEPGILMEAGRWRVVLALSSSSDQAWRGHYRHAEVLKYWACFFIQSVCFILILPRWPLAIASLSFLGRRKPQQFSCLHGSTALSLCHNLVWPMAQPPGWLSNPQSGGRSSVYSSGSSGPSVAWCSPSPQYPCWATAYQFSNRNVHCFTPWHHPSPVQSAGQIIVYIVISEAARATDWGPASETKMKTQSTGLGW